MKTRLIFAFAFALVGCPPGEPPESAPPPPESAGSRADCEVMCDKLAQLKCDFVTGDCIEACTNVESSGITTLCPRAVSRAKDCDDARRRSRCDE